MVEKKTPGSELFGLVEYDQVASFICDALDDLPIERVLAIARGSLKHTEITARKLRRFITKYERQLDQRSK